MFHRIAPARRAWIGAVLAFLVATPAAAAIGDCNGTGRVEINDLITAVNVTLGDTPLEVCRSIDGDGNGVVSVDELIVAVLYALDILPPEGARCGNSFVDGGEECDDGNIDNRDGCDSNCRFEGIGVLDQHWSGYRGACGGFRGGANVGILGPFAQEFVPQLGAVTTVLIDAGSAGSGEASQLRLNIRRATFDGPLLGWASRTVLHPPSSTRQNWIRFDLPAPVAVTPGEVYVFELVGYDEGLSIASAGGDVGCSEREYLPGDPVSHGERATDGDFLFGTFGTHAPGLGAIDQAWFGPQGICGTFVRDASLSGHTLVQTFTPAVDALGAIAIPLSSIAGGAAPAATLTLTVREGGPAGTILTTVQRFIAAPNDGSAWYVFPLVPPLSVTAGAPYAIELSDAADRFAWLAQTGDGEQPGCPEREYAGGDAFVDGAPLESDFPFATYAPVAP